MKMLSAGLEPPCKRAVSAKRTACCRGLRRVREHIARSRLRTSSLRVVSRGELASASRFAYCLFSTCNGRNGLNMKLRIVQRESEDAIARCPQVGRCYAAIVHVHT